MNRLLVKKLWVVVGIFIVLGCTENVTDPGGEEEKEEIEQEASPPSIPNMVAISPDIDFFRENSAGKIQTDHLSLSDLGDVDELEKTNSRVFDRAAQDAVWFTEMIKGIKTGFDFYLSEFDEDDYSFEEGIFVWEVTIDGEDFEEGGQDVGSVTIKMEAEPNASETAVEWRLSVSAEEADLEDALLMDGNSSYDGSEGEWNIYNPEKEDNALMSYEWSVDDEDNLTVEFSVGSAELGEAVTLSYTEEGPDRQLTLNSSGAEMQDIYIKWNEDTGAGYYEVHDIKLCWDSNFENIACSSESGESYEGELPELPIAKFDISYFDDAAAEESMNYPLAQELIQFWTGRIMEVNTSPQPDLREELDRYLLDNRESYTYNGNVLSWEFSSLNSDGNPYEFVLEADLDEAGDRVDWTLSISDSYQFDSDDVVLATTDFKASDWIDVQIYGWGETGASSEPVMEYDQAVNDEKIITSGEYVLVDDYTGTTAKVIYNTGDDVGVFTVQDPEMDLKITWDEAGGGQVEVSNDLMCWDADLEDIPCE